MSYLRPLPGCRQCGRTATLELMNLVGLSLGHWCKKHGDGALRKQQAKEDSTRCGAYDFSQPGGGGSDGLS